MYWSSECLCQSEAPSDPNGCIKAAHDMGSSTMMTCQAEPAPSHAPCQGMARIEELLSTAAASFALPAPLPGPLPEGPPPMELQLALQVDTSGGCQVRRWCDSGGFACFPGAI